MDASVSSESVATALLNLHHRIGPGKDEFFSSQDILAETYGEEIDDFQDDELYRGFVASVNTLHRNPEKYLEDKFVDVIRRDRGEGFKGWEFRLVTEEQIGTDYKKSGFEGNSSHEANKRNLGLWHQDSQETTGTSKVVSNYSSNDQLIQFGDYYLDKNALSLILNRYQGLVESDEYSEDYKWRILDELNEDIQEWYFEPDNVVEFVKVLQSKNPQQGSFAAWNEIDALLKYAENNPEEASDRISNLYHGDELLEERISSLRQSISENVEGGIGAPGIAYMLAAFDREKFVPFKDGAYRDFTDLFSNDKPSKTAVENKLPLYFELCNQVKEFIEEETGSAELLDAQDFIYCSTNYGGFAHNVLLYAVRALVQIYENFKKNPENLFDAIKQFPEDFLEEQKEYYGGKDTPVNTIRFKVLEGILSDNSFDYRGFKDAIQVVQEESETDVMRPWSEFSVLAQIYVNFFQNHNRAIKNLSDALLDGLDNENLKAHIANFQGASNLMTAEPWIAIHPTEKDFKKSPHYSLSFSNDEVKYGLHLGSELESEKPAITEDRESVNDSDLKFEDIIEKYREIEDKFERLSKGEIEKVNQEAVWIEKSYHNREKRQEGERRVGKALWSPQKKKNGDSSTYYDNLKEVEPGDVVLHLDQHSRELVGVSKVKSRYEETEVLENTEWDNVGVQEMGYERGERPCYLVELGHYKEFDQHLPVDEVLTQKNEQVLEKIRGNRSGLVFNRNYNLNQGAYLTKAPKQLVQLIQGTYNEETGEQIPFIEVEGMLVNSSELDILEDLEVDLSESEIKKGLYFPDGVDNDIVDRVEAALNSGKHIIFTGPPGTGKTEIAERVADHIAGEDGDSNVTGYQLTTATSDWSTFDTVGGYMPDKDSQLDFKPGHILRRFKKNGEQENELLVIDEINRSDIDKAFGQLFTVLSGQKVQLPFKEGDEEEREIELIPAKKLDNSRIPEDHEFLIPKSWRMMATMNTYDKTSLYEMSYAFMRRFSFIHVGAPDIPKEDEKATKMVDRYLEAWEENGEEFDIDEEDKRAVIDIWRVTNNGEEGKFEARKIGPALIHDIFSYLDQRNGSRKRVTEAVISYVIPQLEGIPKRDEIVEALKEVDNVDSDILESSAEDILR